MSVHESIQTMLELGIIDLKPEPCDDKTKGVVELCLKSMPTLPHPTLVETSTKDLLVGYRFHTHTPLGGTR